MFNLNKKFYIVIFFFILFFALVVNNNFDIITHTHSVFALNIAQAAGDADKPGEDADKPGEDADKPGEDADKPGDNITFLENPLSPTGDTISTATLFSRIIKGLLSIVGTFSLIAFIFGGTIWLTSSGNDEQIKKGKDIFLYALIGLVVVFSSYVVLSFIIDTLVTT